MAKRDLPWRATRDPYRIWVSEIMLQQTRVAAVVPYYEKFLARFPDLAALATAEEADLLTCWAGLGYYSRARNLHRAAREMAANGQFPSDYERIRALPGVGGYTAAAIASIAFNLPHAVLDGNAVRVLARLTHEAGDVRSSAVRKRLQTAAEGLLDHSRPGEFNQALMELGATVCLPREPQCLLCPLSELCEARRRGAVSAIPASPAKPEPVRLRRTLLLIEQNGKILLWRRGERSRRMRGFWELPGGPQLPQAQRGMEIGRFRHTITRHHYTFTVVAAEISYMPPGFEWVGRDRLAELPASTVLKKALRAAAAREL